MSFIYVEPAVFHGNKRFANDVDIDGNLNVDGTTVLVGGVTIESLIIDSNNAEAFLVRLNADAGDVFNIDTVAQSVEIRDADLVFETGRAVTATRYSIGRDADLTNQLHFNAPAGSAFEFSINDSSVIVVTELNQAFTQPAGTTGSTGFTFNIGAHTAITAATERIGINVPAVTKTWAAGAGPLALQRETVFAAPTYVGNAGGALTITEAATVEITGAPVQGANMTLSSTYAFLVTAGITRLKGVLTASGGGALTGTWTDMGSVTTIDINGGTIDGVTIGGAAAGAITGTTITATTNFVPDADDGAGLGLSGTAFSDLFLALGAVINFNAGDVTITHAADRITVAGGDVYIAGHLSPSASDLYDLGIGASNEWRDLRLGNGSNIFFNANTSITHSLDTFTITADSFLFTPLGASTTVRPTTNDTAALGSATVSWSDLFLASGAIINFANGNFTITHGSATISLSGALLVNTINSTDAVATSVTLQSQTFTAAAEHNAVIISPTWAAENQVHRALNIAPTQNGANSQVLVGARFLMTKATAATVLATMVSSFYASPSVAGTVTLSEAIRISDQSITGITTAYGLSVESQGTAAGTTRAINLAGAGITNAIRLGNSPNIYSNAAEQLTFSDSTDADGIRFVLATGNQSIRTVDVDNTALVLQDQTFTPGANFSVTQITPTFTAANFQFAALTISVTQNGANSSAIEGLVINLTKDTGATVLAASNSLRIASPTVTGTITVHDGFQIDDQAIAGISTSRAFRIVGTGAGNAIVLGNSPLLYSSGAEVIRLDDSTGTRGVSVTLTAAGAQTIGASAGNLQINQASTAGVVFNSGGIDNDFTILSDNNASIFVVDGALDIMSLGEAVNTATTLNVDFPSRIAAVGATESAFLFTSRLTEAGSGTHAALYGTLFESFILTAGDGATTTAATVAISGAPSGASSNYSFFVVAGVSRFGGNVQTAANIDVDMSAGGRLFGGGIQANYQTLAANTNLTLDENDSAIGVTLGSTSDNTITLPAASGNEGMIITVFIVDGAGVNNAVVTRAGADTISNGSADVGNTTVTLQDTGDYVVLQAVSSSVWNIIHESGTAVA